MSTTMMVAVASPPTIVCPPWCCKSEAIHLERLEGNEGVVEHDSEPVDGLSHTIVTFVDGTPVPGRVPRLWVEERPDLDGVTLDEAETFARQILAAVKAARA